jgi:hypothetical protein
MVAAPMTRVAGRLIERGNIRNKTPPVMALIKSGQMKQAIPDKKMPRIRAATKKLSPIAVILSLINTEAGLDGPASRKDLSGTS